MTTQPQTTEPSPQYENPPFQLYIPGEIDDGRGFCFYARGGIGKTSLLLSMIKFGPGLVIDVPQLEGGTEVLGNDLGRKSIRVVRATSWNDLDEFYKYLERGKHPFKWAAIDSVTGTSELAGRKAIKERDLNLDPHQRTQNDFGKIGSLQAELFWKFRSLPIHVVFIAQERSHGRDGQEQMVGPDVTPAALAALLPSMKVVARLRYSYGLSGEVERHLVIGPQQTFYTKYRAVPGVNVPSSVRIPNPEGSTLLYDLIRYLDGVQGIELDVPDENSGIVLIS